MAELELKFQGAGPDLVFTLFLSPILSRNKSGGTVRPDVSLLFLEGAGFVGGNPSASSSR